jgi:hypothetical protein
VLVIAAVVRNGLWMQHAIFCYAGVAGGMGAMTKGGCGGLSTRRVACPLEGCAGMT